MDSPGSAATDFSVLSIAPHNTRAQLIVLVCCVIAYFFSRQLGQERGSRRRLVAWLLILGTFEAVYGLVQYLSGWQRIFVYAKKYNLEEATGTYINRNHFAGFLEMVIPLWTGAGAIRAFEKFVFAAGTVGDGRREGGDCGREFAKDGVGAVCGDRDDRGITFFAIADGNSGGGMLVSVDGCGLGITAESGTVDRWIGYGVRGDFGFVDWRGIGVWTVWKYRE